MLTVEGWGHTSLLAQSRCAQARAAAYLLDPGRRLTDATCDDAFVPFTPATAAQQRTAAMTTTIARSR